MDSREYVYSCPMQVAILLNKMDCYIAELRGEKPPKPRRTVNRYVKVRKKRRKR